MFYMKKHSKGKKQADFNVVLATLQAYELIKILKQPDSDEIIYITTIGLLYYDKHRKRAKKK